MLSNGKTEFASVTGGEPRGSLSSFSVEPIRPNLLGRLSPFGLAPLRKEAPPNSSLSAAESSRKASVYRTTGPSYTALLNIKNSTVEKSAGKDTPICLEVLHTNQTPCTAIGASPCTHARRKARIPCLAEAQHYPPQQPTESVLHIGERHLGRSARM